MLEECEIAKIELLNKIYKSGHEEYGKLLMDYIDLIMDNYMLWDRC